MAELVPAIHVLWPRGLGCDASRERPHFPPPRSGGGGPLSSRSERTVVEGRRIRTFVVGAEGLQRRRCFPYSSNVTSKLNVNARRQRFATSTPAPLPPPLRGRPPPPLSRWRMECACSVANGGLIAARSPPLARQNAGTRGGSRGRRCGHRLRAVALRPGCATLRKGQRLPCPRDDSPNSAATGTSKISAMRCRRPAPIRFAPFSYF